MDVNRNLEGIRRRQDSSPGAGFGQAVYLIPMQAAVSGGHVHASETLLLPVGAAGLGLSKQCWRRMAALHELGGYSVRCI
jgi:hypothetical protein